MGRSERLRRTVRWSAFGLVIGVAFVVGLVLQTPMDRCMAQAECRAEIAKETR